MSEHISISEFARRAGCDEKQVRRAIDKGRLRKGSEGLLDAAQLATAWRRQNRRTRDYAVGAGSLSEQLVRKSSDNLRPEPQLVRTDDHVVRPSEPVVRMHELEGFHLGWSCGGPGLGDDVPLMAAEAVLDAGGDMALAQAVFAATLAKVQDRLRELAAFDHFEPEAELGTVEAYWEAEHFTVPDWTAPRPWPRTDL